MAAEIAARLSQHAVPFFAGAAPPVEALAEYDDTLLDSWAAGDPVPRGALDSVVRRELARTTIVPILTGSARVSLSGRAANAGRVHPMTARLPDLTGGAGSIMSELDHYRPVHGVPPERPRVGPDPLKREAWFREMPR